MANVFLQDESLVPMEDKRDRQGGVILNYDGRNNSIPRDELSNPQIRRNVLFNMKAKCPVIYLVLKYPKKRWNWYRITKNKSVTMDIIRDFPFLPWVVKAISENPNIDISMIKRYSNSLDPIKYSRAPIPPQDILDNLDIPWDYTTILGKNPKINDTLIRYIVDNNLSDNGFYDLTGNPGISWQTFREYVENDNISNMMSDIYYYDYAVDDQALQNDQLIDWNLFSFFNPKHFDRLSIETLRKFPENHPIWNIYTYQERLPLEFIRDNPNLHWDYAMLLFRPDLTEEYYGIFMSNIMRWVKLYDKAYKSKNWNYIPFSPITLGLPQFYSKYGNPEIFMRHFLDMNTDPNILMKNKNITPRIFTELDHDIFYAQTLDLSGVTFDLKIITSLPFFRWSLSNLDYDSLTVQFFEDNFKLNWNYHVLSSVSFEKDIFENTKLIANDRVRQLMDVGLPAEIAAQIVSLSLELDDDKINEIIRIQADSKM
jgi:hypothetical protein